MSLFSSLEHLIKDAVLPPVCAVCGSLCQTDLCKSCLSKISFMGPSICSRCGSPKDSGIFPFPGPAGSKYNEVSSCSLCRQENFSFYMARSFAIYGKEVAQIIHKYKYRKLYFLSDIILYFLKIAYEYYYSGQRIDIIETVPAYNENMNNWTAELDKEKKDSLSHMQLLAAKLSSSLKIPFGDDIIKIKKTSKQQGQGRMQRKINLRDSFKVKNCLKVYGKNILLVDDVWTTGSTLNEISRQLKNAGAEKIFILTVARGML